MPGSAGAEDWADDVGQPSVSRDADRLGGGVRDAAAQADAFQTLASEVRIAVLARLRAAERADETPLSFSELRRGAGTDCSAGFAYHLRQLDGRFVTEVDGGYVLTRAGRRAADAIVAGAFTDDADWDHRAS